MGFGKFREEQENIMDYLALYPRKYLTEVLRELLEMSISR